MATHKHLMALMGKKGFTDEERHKFIEQWTDGRTSSSREITQRERDEMCSYLETGRVADAFNPNMELLLRQKRSVVLAIATRTGIHDTDDWAPFNRFMRFRSVHKKALRYYDLDELDELVRQFRGIEANNGKARKGGNNESYGKGNKNGNQEA